MSVISDSTDYEGDEERYFHSTADGMRWDIYRLGGYMGTALLFKHVLLCGGIIFFTEVITTNTITTNTNILSSSLYGRTFITNTTSRSCRGGLAIWLAGPMPGGLFSIRAVWGPKNATKCTKMPWNGVRFHHIGDFEALGHFGASLGHNARA